MIEAFKIVDLPNVLTNGGPGIATESLTLHAFMAWRTLDLGGSAAVAYMLLFVVTFFCVSFATLTRRGRGWPHEGDLRPADARHRRARRRSARSVSYVLLGFWAFVVLFPLYWVAITSLKLPIDVNDGPFYLPFIDFQPSLHAWQYIFVDMLRRHAAALSSTR